MFCSLLFLAIVLFSNGTYAQGTSIDKVLESIDPGDRRTMKADFLSEKGCSDFDPEDELDSVKSFRVRKELDETESAKRNHDSRMADECHCVFNICMEAVRRNDTRTQAQIEADRKRAQRARKRRKSLCWRWYCSGGANSSTVARLGLPFARESECPGGKIRAGGDSGDFYRKLKKLESELEREEAIEERLRRQRRRQRLAYEKRECEARVAAKKAREERLRREAEAKHQEREAKRAAWCRLKWSRGSNPCSCGAMAAAPAWVKNASTCEK